MAHPSHWKSFELSDDPQFFIPLLSNVLTHYAYSQIRSSSATAAKESLRLALLLYPDNVPAWSYMAVACAELDCLAEAAQWADKVLTFRPDPDSPDPLQKALAQTFSDEGEAEFAEVFGEPEALGYTKEMRQLMHHIKKRASER